MAATRDASDDALAAQFIAMVPQAQRSGLIIDHMARGEARLRLPLEPNTNHIGTMYAGGLFLIAEFVGGVVCAHSFDLTGYAPIVKGLDIRFRRPATTDVTVEAHLDEDEIARITADANAHGKADFQLEVEVLDASGQVVATSTGQYQLRRIR